MRADRLDGFTFEEKAFGLLQAHVASEKFGFIPECSKVYWRRPYFSRDRNAEIIFDIAIEVTLPTAPEPSFLWLWECKNLSRALSVDDVEEFNSKVQQVAGLNVKAGVISSGPFQRGTIDYAHSRRIAMIRLLPDNQVTWHLYYSQRPPEDYITNDIMSALTIGSFHANNRAEFAASHFQTFQVVSQMIKYYFNKEAPDIAEYPEGYRLRL